MGVSIVDLQKSGVQERTSSASHWSFRPRPKVMRNSIARRAARLAVVIVLCASALPGQNVVTGVVRDGESGRPVEGARVQLLGTPRLVYADSVGRYRMDSVSTGVVRLRFSRLGFVHTDTSIEVMAPTTRIVDVALAQPLVLLRGRSEVWLGCSHRVPRVECSEPQRLPLTYGMEAPGAWVLDDSAQLAEFLRTQTDTSGTITSRDYVDWSKEFVVAVGYGGHSGCGPASYVNRVERRAGRIEIVLGPDTAGGGGGVTCMAFFYSVDVIRVARPHGRVTFRPASPAWRTPPPIRTLRKPR